jgi:UDP-N-acetylglucosamine--N-acetylmuramyl-(pentapeptide) pyrophosphoryl-undecaprenol N-acetylglucosamine transferase
VAVIWATGRREAEAYLGAEGPLVRVRPYLTPIADAYAAADVAVTRAGAMTIAELCAWGIPSILVPLPTAAQDHQTQNARATALAGAALHLPQGELSATRLGELVVALQHDQGRRAAMADAARARGRPSAAQAIARGVLAAMGIA